MANGYLQIRAFLEIDWRVVTRSDTTRCTSQDHGALLQSVALYDKSMAVTSVCC